MTQPPIVPGNPQPDPDQPQQWQSVYPQPPTAPEPQPVYYVPAPPNVPQPSTIASVVNKSAIGTITVIVTLFAVFCLLPMALCVGCGALGAMTSPPN